jgi:conjugal transfer ATP-binding protein TraC
MRISDKAAWLFGEKESQREASLTSPLAPWLKIPRLRTLLPYEGYDPETKLFFNKGTTGFVLIGDPLVGASLKDQGQMADFFRQDHHLVEGTSLQFLLWASPRIRPFFNHWLHYKEGEVFHKLA